MSVLVAEYASVVKLSIRRALLISVSGCIHFYAILLPFIGLLTTARHHSSSKRSIVTDQSDGVAGAGVVNKCFRP